MIYVRLDKQELRSKDWEKGLIEYGMRHLARECIINQETRDFSYEYSNDFEYVVILFANTSIFSKEQLTDNCRKTLQYCRTELDISPVFLISQNTQLWDIAQRRTQLEGHLKQVSFYPGSINVENPVDKKTGCLTLPEWDRQYIDNCLVNNQIGVLTPYIGNYITKALELNKGYGSSVMQNIHQNILQLFYSLLERQRIDARMLFDCSEAYKIEEKCESSKQDMIEFFSFLIHKSKELLEGNKDQSVVDYAVAYIDNHYKEDISRDDVAKAACVTPNYLSALYHSQTGCTIREYINECRIRESKRLLLNTKMAVSDIAVDCGFGNMSYFSTVFRKATGMSPSDWRKKQKSV